MTHVSSRALRWSATFASILALSAAVIVPSAAAADAADVVGDPHPILLENAHAANKVLEIANPSAQATIPDGETPAAAAIFPLADAPDAVMSQAVFAYPIAGAADTYVLASGDGDILARRDNADPNWRYLEVRDVAPAEAAADPYALWSFVDAGDGDVYVHNAQPGPNGLTPALDMYNWATADAAEIQTYDAGTAAVQRWSAHTLDARVADVDQRTEPGSAPELPETVTARYDWGRTQEAAVVWHVPEGEQWTAEGVVAVDGTATGWFGEDVPVHAQVLVGAVGDALDAAVTVHQGASLRELRMQAPATVERTVSGSDTTVTSRVTWDWSAVTDADLAEPGTVEIPATEGTGFVARLVVTVVATEETNVLREPGVHVDYTHMNGSTFALTDGVRDAVGFDDWRGGGAANRVNPNTISFYFERPRQLTGAAVFDAGQATNVGGVTVQYRDLVGGWVDLPARDVSWPHDNDAAGLALSVESDTVLASGLRVAITHKSDASWMTLSEIEAYGPALAG
ncbi:Ig-like domain-containing protein [Microbacterium excoecariae]|uniref:Ig-like domain-containing protein n=1 Tax=Microbacterium excoecariae TaxID=2715210 RepID=UPI001407AA20|nr:Ig-like domain-containing protein [Microbacterium excoecariae]NHI16570.1 hypothetical protein [Microbacterium excoecariae]